MLPTNSFTNMNDIEKVRFSGDEANYKNFYREYIYDRTIGEYYGR